jgi:ubiquinone biosynthesis protein Coq4
MPFEFMNQKCQLTLQEALDKYYQSNPDFFQPKESANDYSKKIFLAHDVCHLVFGCDTSMLGETIITYWIFFGTSIGVRRYATAVINTIFAGIGESKMRGSIMTSLSPKRALETLMSTPKIIKTIIKAWKMNKKWDFYNYKPFLDNKLSDIRKEFNICI